ncbi:MAG: molybdopterin-dependent oxidoreductase [Pseudomonadales bacterium]|nr:molybdopterin-dependent oxidoreductase [Halioglobus sp.]MCP5120921.1 molybdopterin-dependent oxidoreductase [Pseudomonadales bacterium]MCP5194363.1 molybdopterin-dependent oxidoreductase [Pseudomonadales bacterium]
MSTCNTTCPYCGVGCGVTAELEGDQLIAVRGDVSHPANAGRLCVKGTTLAETLTADGRLLHPMLRGARTDWDTALDLVARQVASVRSEYGPEAIAFYLSGQLLTEDYYVANKLMKGFLGSANVDTNSRLCMASAVAGYQRAFGADFVPCSYQDLETCDLLVMVGSNAAWTHPVLYQRIAEARKQSPHKRVVVIDPRRTASCDIADLHLQIAPGSDGFLFAGLLRQLQHDGRLDDAYIAAQTAGSEAALAAVATWTPERVAARTGLAPEDLAQFYQLFGATERTVTFYSQGINQSATGTDKCNAIINCHLATGRLGRPGMGPFSITGQPNAMGGREVGGMANHLAAHMDFRRDHVELVARFWQAPAMASAPGLKAVDMFQAAAEGKIRFLWIMATNPVVSLPDSAMVRRALANCEFVVVSDCVSDTDTAACADLLLPAMGWGEKDGTVTNSERCISRQRRLVPPVGEARADWWMVTEVARRLGFGHSFDYRGPADIFAEHARLSGYGNNGSRAFDISALADLDQAAYDQLAPTCWPRPAIPVANEPQDAGRFFTVSGRAQFIATLPAMPDSGGAGGERLQLNTGRLRDQWHTMTRTGRVAKLMRHRDFFSIGVSTADALVRQLRDGDLVEVCNELGSIRGVARLEDELPPGQVFSPIHWSRQFSGRACVSELIAAVTDPVSGQPQSKFARVEVLPLATSCWGLLLTRRRPVLPPLGYWSRVVVPGGYLTLLAGAASTRPGELYASLQRALGSEPLRRCSYHDESCADYREAGLEDGEIGYALFLHSKRASLPSRDWLAGVFRTGLPADPTVLLAGVNPGAADNGRLICTCWEVGERQIAQAIGAGTSTVAGLGAQLRCGTQCGSCVPELRRLLHAGLNNKVA